MDTRANYAIIGIFTVAVIAAAFGFVFWFSGRDTGQAKQAYRVVFNGSVAGLSKGASVLFNGIRVGDVTTVYFDAKKPEQAFATIQVERNTPVKTDTSASLDVAILSGTALVALNGGGETSPALEAKAGEDMPTIEAQRGGISSLLETARGTTERANDLLDGLNGIVAGNRESINRTLQNVEAFSSALGKSAPGIDKLLTSLSSVADRIGPVATKLESLTEDTDALIRAIDRQRVATIIASVDNTLQTVNDNRAKIGSILADTSTLMRQLNDVAPTLNSLLSDAGRVVAAVDAVKLSNIVDGTSRFATSLSNSSRDVEATARNANSLTAKLDQAAGRIDGVLKAAENFLGSAAGQEGQSTFASIRAAADSVRKSADNLSVRATEISGGITRLSGAGTRQLEGVAGDARRTIGDVGRAARNLERNPQSVIFGGGRAAIPDYSGR